MATPVLVKHSHFEMLKRTFLLNASFKFHEVTAILHALDYISFELETYFVYAFLKTLIF